MKLGIFAAVAISTALVSISDITAQSNDKPKISSDRRRRKRIDRSPAASDETPTAVLTMVWLLPAPRRPRG